MSIKMNSHTKVTLQPQGKRWVVRRLADSRHLPIRVPYTLFNDFETGELYGWEAYPYAEDIGFEAFYSTQKEPTYKDSKYALARLMRANDTVSSMRGLPNG